MTVPKKIPSGYKVFCVEITQSVSFSVAARSKEEVESSVECYGANFLLDDSLALPDVHVLEDRGGVDLESVDNGVGPDGDLLDAKDWLDAFPDFKEPPAPDTETLPLFPEKEKA